MSKISVYDAGKAKNKSALRGYREVIAGSGTFPGNPLQQHFGVPGSMKYDIVVVFTANEMDDFAWSGPTYSLLIESYIIPAVIL